LIYLEREASELYFDLTRYYLHAEKLSRTHYLDRMVALKEMCEHDDPTHLKATKVLLAEEWDGDDNWWVGNEKHDRSLHSSGRDDASEDGVIQKGLSRDRKGYFQFLSRKKGLNDWVFHQYDADFHPSIPHGHSTDNRQLKLDAYLGWTYIRSTQRKRLGRALIIDLWNDHEFRIFAYKAIDWYKGEFPSYNWRVPHPLMLPKRR
jgi:hypothetical protein